VLAAACGDKGQHGSSSSGVWWEERVSQMIAPLVQQQPTLLHARRNVLGDSEAASVCIQLHMLLNRWMDRQLLGAGTDGQVSSQAVLSTRSERCQMHT
jgi:hypothetical protein